MKTTTWTQVSPLLRESSSILWSWDSIEDKYGIRWNSQFEDNFDIVDEKKFALFVLKYS